jgi:hypothetical protein
MAIQGNLNPSARIGVVGVIDPDAYAAGTYTTGWIDMQDYFALMGVVMVGDMVASSTVDGKFQQATDSSGTGVKDVTGSAITQLTKAGTDDNKQVAINLRQSDLDRNNNFRFVRLSMTVATAASDAGGIVIATDTRYGAGTDTDATTVDEVVS